MRAIDTGILSDNESQAFFQNFSFINCIVIYLSIKDILERIKIPKLGQKLIVLLGKTSFGIYLLHVLVMGLPISKYVKNKLLLSGIHPMLAIWLYVFYVFLLGFVVTWGLQKIPVIKGIVNG